MFHGLNYFHVCHKNFQTINTVTYLLIRHHVNDMSSPHFVNSGIWAASVSVLCVAAAQTVVPLVVPIENGTHSDRHLFCEKLITTDHTHAVLELVP